MDMILDLVKDLFGPTVEFDVSNLFVYDAVRQSEANRGAGRLNNTGSAVLRTVVNCMVQHMESPISLSEIATLNATSVRSLNRMFSNELHMTPGKYYLLLRLARARDMAVETHLPINEIALQTGFSSSSGLSRAFSSHYDMPISHLRKTKRAS
jgi:transcriptional regulator GlxA family with amidase domain